MTFEGPAPLSDRAQWDESSLDAPNCPRCLTRMEPHETERGGLHWACAVCGHAAVA